jgi:purine-binding chemotaxis protein CheW
MSTNSGNPEDEAEAEELRARARRLAMPRQANRSSDREDVEVLCFGLGLTSLALASQEVHGVAPYLGVTALPGVQEGLCGIIAFRGRILPLFDLRHRFGITHRSASDRASVIAVGWAEPEFGLLADDIREVTTLVADELSPVPLGHKGADLLRGITSAGWMVVDSTKLLADSSLWIGEEAQR